MDTNRYEALLNLYVTWLQRSSRSPLNFKVALVGKGLGVTEYIVASLLSHQRRRKDVDFQWNFDASPEFAGIELTQMPMLESIQLEAFIYSDQGGKIVPRVSFVNSIRLQRFDLRGFIELGHGERPMHTLRVARFERICEHEVVKQFMDILKIGPNLEELDYTFHILYKKDINPPRLPLCWYTTSESSRSRIHQAYCWG